MSVSKVYFQNNKFPIKSWKGYYCLSPFVMVQITIDGSVRLCGCGAWMPITVGNILKSTLVEILSSPIAQQVRQSIIDGTYEYCNEKQCGIIINNQLNTVDKVPPNILPLLDDSYKFVMPYEISLHGDQICNLSCPSCRTHVIKNSPEQEQHQTALGNLIYKNLFSQPTDQRVHLMVSGTGEIFASSMLLNFLNSIDITAFPNLALSLNTNGLLAQKNWDRIQHLEKNIHKITVSIDACKANTYEQIRRGGSWKQLLSSIKFLQERCNQTGAKFHARMIVQQQNYQQAVEFYDWCKSWNVDVVEYSQINNWGTWTPDEFRQHNVFDTLHPEYQQLKQTVSNLKQLPNVWFEGMAL